MAVARRAQSLLLWGGIGLDSVPFLEPAFLVDAPPTLPQSTGEYGLTGRTDSGTELFSLRFAMPIVADAEDGSGSFALLLPVQIGWMDDLASITLTGPTGSATLHGDSDLPMAILHDTRTGRVHGFLRDGPDLALIQADEADGLSANLGLEVLFSRGIPEMAAWQRSSKRIDIAWGQRRCARPRPG